MTLHDYYLRADDQATLESALETTGLAISHEGELHVTVPGAINIDVIGLIPEGEEGDTFKPGYHANLRLTFELDAERLAQLPLIVPPETPYRTWQ